MSYLVVYMAFVATVCTQLLHMVYGLYAAYQFVVTFVPYADLVGSFTVAALSTKERINPMDDRGSFFRVSRVWYKDVIDSQRWALNAPAVPVVPSVERHNNEKNALLFLNHEYCTISISVARMIHHFAKQSV